MKRYICALLIFAMLLCLLCGCGDTGDIPSDYKNTDFGLTSSGLEIQYYDDDGMPYTEERNQILYLTNIERQKANLPPLCGNDVSSSLAAFKRASESSQVFEHQRPNGDSWDTIINEIGISDYIGVGENLARMYDTPSEVVTAWMDSPDHKENIMGNYTHMGVGVYKKDGVTYYTQIFVRYIQVDENGNELEDLFGNEIKYN